MSQSIQKEAKITWWTQLSEMFIMINRCTSQRKTFNCNKLVLLWGKSTFDWNVFAFFFLKMKHSDNCYWNQFSIVIRQLRLRPTESTIKTNICAISRLWFGVLLKWFSFLFIHKYSCTYSFYIKTLLIERLKREKEGLNLKVIFYRIEFFLSKRFSDFDFYVSMSRSFIVSWFFS